MDHCGEGGFVHRNRLHSADDKKFFDEDQVDSGLGSIGYCSGDLSSYEQSRQFEEIKEEEVHQKDNRLFSGEHHISSSSNVRPCVDNIVHSLDRLSIANSKSSTSDSTRCDSGLEDCVSGLDLDSLGDFSNWVSPPFSPDQIVDIFSGDEDGDNHLHLSIIHGLPEVSMQVIGLAPDAEWLSQANNMMQTPLHLAVITRQLSVVRRLMCAGASLDVLDLAGNTPLHNACRLGFDDVVRTLLTPVIYEETYQNRYEAPTQRIPQDLEIRNYEGLTCLHLAALGGHSGVMRLLLSSGANVNAAEGKGGRTVLHLAADWGHIEMLRYLLSRQDTHIDARTYSGLTPILLAYGRNRVDAIEELYKVGASCDTLSLSEESDEDASDEEMTEEISYITPYSSTAAGRTVQQASSARPFQPTNR